MLVDAHTTLLWQVLVRAEAVLTKVADGQWPQQQLERLVDYLLYELLDQTMVEDRLLYHRQLAPDRTSQVIRLGQDHTRLRAVVDSLVGTATGGRRDAAELAATVDALRAQLEAHLRREEAAWGSFDEGARDRAAAALRGRPHDWFPLTEGDVIDLGALPDKDMVPAALDRLLRLRTGEQIEVSCSHELRQLWLQLNHRDPGGYGWWT
jgi:hypothetical protein